MNKATLTLSILTAGLLTLGIAGVAISDSDGERHEKHEKSGGWLKPRADVAPVTNALYSQECGSCHMAYQPGLLPAPAWGQIMEPAALADHYGDVASLADEARTEISAYLTANSAEQAERPRSRAFSKASASQGTDLPRITETRYFIKKHDEIPARLVAGNKDVGSFSQCNACHRGADKGIYNEDEVVIPGVGRWED